MANGAATGRGERQRQCRHTEKQHEFAQRAEANRTAEHGLQKPGAGERLQGIVGDAAGSKPQWRAADRAGKQPQDPGFRE
jgi:hypothetical protein